MSEKKQKQSVSMNPLVRLKVAAPFLLPSILAFAVFIILPIVLTVAISFTNYSGNHHVDQQQALDVLLQRSEAAVSSRLNFWLVNSDSGLFRLLFKTDEAEYYITSDFMLSRDNDGPLILSLTDIEEGNLPVLSLREVIQLRRQLTNIEVVHDKKHFRIINFRQFAEFVPRFELAGSENIKDIRTGTIYRPDTRSGFYTSEEGDQLLPGFVVNTGISNFQTVLQHPVFSVSFFSVLLWNIQFATLSTCFTLLLGIMLALCLNQSDLRGRATYRILLIFPYAVPAFISILIFRGLFNPDYGEINLILGSLLDIAPRWFQDPWYSRLMILIVNTWLGYPFFMLLGSALLRTIPEEMYESAAVLGAGAINRFRYVCLPLLWRPLIPLVLVSFAFNFNNFLLINLLTRGGPDYAKAISPAGYTDLLVSYSYRLAFSDQGQNFGLAAAISVTIFMAATALAFASLRFIKLTRPGLYGDANG